MARRTTKPTAKRHFGNTRQLQCNRKACVGVDDCGHGRWQARYTGPDGREYRARTTAGKPLTFDSRYDAEAWLTLRHAEILRGEWLPPAEPKAPPVTFSKYADAWLASRELAPRTRDHYRHLLDDHIVPTFGKTPVAAIQPAAVRDWHAKLARASGKGKTAVKDRPTTRAHAYGLLRTIMNTAVADEVIDANPCRVRGGGQAKRVKKIRPASLPELEALTKAMPERLRLMVLLASWCAMRFGELAELRRSDIDLTNGVVHVRRGVGRVDDTDTLPADTKVCGCRPGCVIGPPKSDAGVRDVNIPPHLLPAVKAHLKANVTGRDGLLFPAATGESARHLAPSSLYRAFYPARDAAGRSDLRFHDLRHTGATLAAATGATLAELMARLGHSTPGAAMRYQHAAQDRDREIAGLLSKMVTGTGDVTPIGAKKKARKKRAAGR